VRFITAVLLLAGPSALGCSSALPHPPYSPQATNALTQVDFGPPPGRVEVVPKRPPGADAWIDGEWIRRHDRWYWLVGRWVKTPPGWSFSPWVFVRAVDGTPYYAPSVWKDQAGNAAPAPAALAYATASAEAVFNPENELENTGRNLKTAPAPPIVPSAVPERSDATTPKP
jgi:hypothetical protein